MKYTTAEKTMVSQILAIFKHAVDIMLSSLFHVTCCISAGTIIEWGLCKPLAWELLAYDTP